MKNLSESKLKFLNVATDKFGSAGQFKNKDMLDFVDSLGIDKKEMNWIFNNKYKVSRGLYQLPKMESEGGAAVIDTKNEIKPQLISQVVSIKKNMLSFNPNAQSEFNYTKIPDRDPLYVPFGEYKAVELIVKRRVFFPIFISGFSGNGKSTMVEQICARNNRAMIRVQMTRETDEDDLIGGFRLIDGETKFMKGPVLRAMEMGAILLIDEADRCDPGKVMCLQGILEGKSYYVKKTGEVIEPVLGFNIIVTANTKGKGSDDGRYIAAGILDDSWLERFVITIEQNFPEASVEKRILNGYLCDNYPCTDEDKVFVDHLIAWADIIRKTFEEGAIDELISTRRLVHIIKTYKIFNNRMRAVELCINRFDSETKNSFLELYAKVDPTLVPETLMGVDTLVVSETASADSVSIL